MVLNFPANPTVGTIYMAPSGVKYVYDGIKWSGQVAVMVSDQLLYTTSSVMFNNLYVSSTEDSIEPTTGAVVIEGGVGIGGDFYTAGVVRIQNTSSNTTSDTGALVVVGGVGIGGNIHVQGYGHFGLEPTVAYINPLGVFTGDYNGYVQMGIQNINAGTSASSDVVLTTDDGSDSTNYIDLGINNSQFGDSQWGVSGPRDGYLYVNGNNLTIGVDTPAKTISFHVGGTQASNIVATFREPGTASTGSTNGSFTVSGGVGLDGDVHIGQTLHIGPDYLDTLPDSLLIGTGNTDSYTQVNIRNASSGFYASADFVVTADDGTDASNFIDLGINNSNYTTAGWTVSGAHDGYLYINGGNLTLGTDSTGTTVKVHIGGTLSENIVATFNSVGTNSTSSTTGAMTINGGLGVDGSINAPQVFSTPVVTFYADTVARDLVTGHVRGSIILVGTEFQGYNGATWVTLG